jgi:hypothetical protein
MRRATLPTACLIVLALAAGVTPKIRRLFLNREKANSQTAAQSQSDKGAAWQTLLLFENQPLSKLAKPQAEQLQKAIDALVRKRENEFLVPRLLTTISDSKGQTRYALIEESPLLTIPGNSGLSVHVFTQDGSLLRSSVFQTGWRIVVTNIRVIYLAQINRMALEVRSAPVINGRDVAKQFYALINDDVLLIRLEDKAGHLIRNAYGAPNHTFGLTITGRSANDWQTALESADPAETLATLTWLSGTHLDPKEPLPVAPQGWPEVSHEDISEARLASAVRTREGVQRNLKALLLSQNLWVRQAAKLAEKREDYSFGIKIG